MYGCSGVETMSTSFKGIFINTQTKSNLAKIHWWKEGPS